MATAWAELTEQGGRHELAKSHWLLEHLLQAEATDRAMRSIRHQMSAARFPMHRDLAGFDFEASPVDEALIGRLATLEFTEAAHNVVLVAVELALESGPPSGRVSVEHVLNVLARLSAPSVPEQASTALRASVTPLADTARYDRLRALSLTGEPS